MATPNLHRFLMEFKDDLRLLLKTVPAEMLVESSGIEERMIWLHDRHGD